MSEYYDHVNVPATGSPLSSATMRAEFAAIEQGFDKLPTLAGNANKIVKVNPSGTALETTDTPDINGGTIDDAAVNLDGGSLVLPQGAAAAPVTEGQVYWNTSTDTLTVGNGTAAEVLVTENNAQTLSNKTLTNATISATSITADVITADIINGGANASIQSFSGDGVTTTFGPLTSDPASENNTQVYVSGVYQEKDAYSLAAQSITFSAPPPAGSDNIEVIWNQIFQVGATSSDLVAYTPAGTGAVATTVQAKLREWVSVKDFGAKGDGTTDDAAAIQAAANASVGKTLFFPAGTYIVGTTINLPSNIRLAGDKGHSVIKLRSQSWGAANGLMFALSVDTDVQFDSLVFDGNKGNVGTSRSPLIVIFRAQRVSFENCIFQNAEGICLNASSDVDDYRVIGCQFLSCGGNPNGSDGYQWQAIAFSSDGTWRSRNIRIEGNYFYQQGLDCLSLADCDNVLVANNLAVDGYTLVYTNPPPRTTTNLTIEGNVVRTCSMFGGTSKPYPLAVDLPSVDGVIVTGNSFYDIDSSAIGIFNNAKNVTITGNTIINPMRGPVPTKVSGIILGGESGDVALNNIIVEGNLIVDTAGTPLMKFGIVVKSNATNVLVRDNVIRNPLTARYGKYTGDALDANITAFTAYSEVASSCRVVDLDVANNLETVHGRLYLQTTDNTNPAMRITQLGTGPVFVVEDQSTTDTTMFMIDEDGDVGIRVNPAIFGAKLTLSGTGSALSAFQSASDDAIGPILAGHKTRSIDPYANAMVQNNDVALRLDGRPNDGMAYRINASIQMVVDGTPAANDMPGRIEFWTAPAGTTTIVRRLSLKQGGALRFIPQTQPATAEAGDVYYDSGTNKLRCYNGTTWNDLF